MSTDPAQEFTKEVFVAPVVMQPVKRTRQDIFDHLTQIVEIYVEDKTLPEGTQLRMLDLTDEVCQCYVDGWAQVDAIHGQDPNHIDGDSQADSVCELVEFTTLQRIYPSLRKWWEE